MADNYIQTSNLRDVTKRLNEEADEINQLFNGKVLKALEACQDELKVSGLNYDEIQNTFKSVFKSAVDQLKELTTAMDTTILPKYEATAASIAKLFNQDFANEMSNYLNQIKSE